MLKSTYLHFIFMILIFSLSLMAGCKNTEYKNEIGNDVNYTLVNLDFEYYATKIYLLWEFICLKYGL